MAEGSNRLEAATKRGLCPKLSTIWRSADPVGRTSNRTGQTDHGSVARRRLGSILTELEILLLASRGFTSRPGKYADGRGLYLIVASATSPSPQTSHRSARRRPWCARSGWSTWLCHRPAWGTRRAAGVTSQCSKRPCPRNILHRCGAACKMRLPIKLHGVEMSAIG
jgi:hypothetical protein